MLLTLEQDNEMANHHNRRGLDSSIIPLVRIYRRPIGLPLADNGAAGVENQDVAHDLAVYLCAHAPLLPPSLLSAASLSISALNLFISLSLFFSSTRCTLVVP